MKSDPAAGKSLTQNGLGSFGMSNSFSAVGAPEKSTTTGNWMSSCSTRVGMIDPVRITTISEIGPTPAAARTVSRAGFRLPNRLGGITNW